MATFYRYLPDLSIAQVMFTVGLTVALLGALGLPVARMRWLAAVCVHPVYASYLPAVTAAVGPELTEFAGLPGAPARISQVAEIYRQDPGNGITITADVSSTSEFILPDLLPGQPGGTSAQFASQLEQTLGLDLASHVILGSGPAAANPSQAALAVIAGSVRFPPSVGPLAYLMAGLYGLYTD